MTIKQKQCLLAYLGYYDGAIDGIWGAMSKSATEAFQRDYQLTVDGNFGDVTAQRIREVIASGETPIAADGRTGWEDVLYFVPKEFACKCGKYCDGYPAKIDMGMVKIADAIRARIGKPITINSGLRCKTHNANVGGVSNSQHLYGNAADLGCPSGVTPSQMAAIAEDIMGNTGGIGTYGWGIHIDTRATKSRWNG